VRDLHFASLPVRYLLKVLRAVDSGRVLCRGVATRGCSEGVPLVGSKKKMLLNLDLVKGAITTGVVDV
jgi:hypothetical protein